MSSKPRGKNPATKLPTEPCTEISAAKLRNYTYLPQNEISDKYRREQDVSISNCYSLIDGNGIRCNCPVQPNGKRCINNECPNRIQGIACQPDCGQKCQNNPWQHGNFAITQGKLYVAKVGKTDYYGVFAFKTIDEGSYVGEYTGVVSRNRSPLVPKEADFYAFEMTRVEQQLDGYTKGSVMKLCNCSCDPNAEGTMMVHNGEYKVVFVALKTIRPHQQVTIDYGWTFDEEDEIKKCQCDAGNKCNQKLGALKTETPLRNPTTFTSLFFNDDASSRLICLLSMPVLPRDLDHNFKDDHIFLAAEEVAAIICENNHLVIILGRIIECYENDHGQFFYVVRQISPAIRDHHLPMWLVFRHREFAALELMHTYSSEEKRKLKKHLSAPQNKATSNKIRTPIVPTYYQLMLTNGFETPVVHPTLIEGAVALGLSNVVVKYKKKPATEEDNTKAKRNRRVITKKTVPISTASPCTSEISMQPAKQDSIQDLPKQSFVSERVVLEDANSTNAGTNSLANDINIKSLNSSLLHSQFSDTLDTLVHFMLKRKPQNQSMEFREAYQIAQSKLGYYYFDCSGTSRCFLLYSHYRLATEVETTGSLRWRWCSLCRLEHTFETEEEMLNHFYLNHAVCARNYKCQECGLATNFPSIFRDHVSNCSPDSMPLFLAGTTKCLWDACADYVAFRSHIIHFKDTCKQIHCCGETSDALTGNDANNPNSSAIETAVDNAIIAGIAGANHKTTKLEMDVRTKRPKDAKYVPSPVVFAIETRCVAPQLGKPLVYANENDVISPVNLQHITRDEPTPSASRQIPQKEEQPSTSSAAKKALNKTVIDESMKQKSTIASKENSPPMNVHDAATQKPSLSTNNVLRKSSKRKLETVDPPEPPVAETQAEKNSRAVAATRTGRIPKPIDRLGVSEPHQKNTKQFPTAVEQLATAPEKVPITSKQLAAASGQSSTAVEQVSATENESKRTKITKCGGKKKDNNDGGVGSNKPL